MPSEVKEQGRQSLQVRDQMSSMLSEHGPRCSRDRVIEKTEEEEQGVEQVRSIVVDRDKVVSELTTHSLKNSLVATTVSSQCQPYAKEPGVSPYGRKNS